MNTATARFQENGNVPHCKAAIENLPHLAEKMCTLWKSRDLNDFVHHVLLDTRDGKRQGLPFEVAQEMIFISKLNTLVRAMDAAPKLQVSLEEAGKIIANGDRTARGLAPSDADPWSDQEIRRDRRQTSRAPRSEPAAPVPKAVAPRPAMVLPKGSTGYYLSLFLNETPPAPSLVRLDLTAPESARTALFPNQAPPAMDREFFRCIAREIRDEGVDELVLSHPGNPEKCPWVAEAVLYAKQHCRFPQVALRVDTTTASEKQLDEAIAAGADSLILEFSMACKGWRTRAEEKLARNSHHFSSWLSHLIQKREECHARNHHRCLLKVVHVGKPLPSHWLTQAIESLAEKADVYTVEWLPDHHDLMEGNRSPAENCLCWPPFVEANIRSSGHLVVCAHDSLEASRVANLKEMEFSRAWHHPDFRQTRRALLDGNLKGSLCSACPRQPL